MADIDIDRQLLASAGKQEPSVALRVLWTLAVIAVAGAAALVGFKLGSNSAELGPSLQTRINVNQIQQQLDDIQMRLDNLERHRRVVVVTPAGAQPKAAVANSAGTNPSPSPEFTISSASAMKPETDTTPGPAAQLRTGPRTRLARMCSTYPTRPTMKLGKRPPTGWPTWWGWLARSRANSAKLAIR